MITCPSCIRTWSGELSLATHLIDAHGLPAPIAAERARFVARDNARMKRKVEKKVRKKNHHKLKWEK